MTAINPTTKTVNTTTPIHRKDKHIRDSRTNDEHKKGKHVKHSKADEDSKHGKQLMKESEANYDRGNMESSKGKDCMDKNDKDHKKYGHGNKRHAKNFYFLKELLANLLLKVFVWNGNWAFDCDFPGNDLKSVASSH